MLKRSTRNTILWLVCGMTSGAATPGQAADESERTAGSESLSAMQTEFFETRIRPVLVEHCYACHSADAKVIKGNLLLDSKDAVLTGGDSGPALLAGKPEASLLMQALRHEGLEMPPDGKLPENVLNDFASWIRDGAADPRIAGTGPARRTIDIEQGRRFWSFRPVVKPEVPVAGESWAKSDLDRFVAAAHGQKAIAGDASPEVLIRRLTFVLTGLPPSLDEQTQFATAWAEDQDQAMQVMVDRLLSSPRFGERWGRHWLDVARFAESTGGGRSMMLPDAWRFRDYIVRSFNEDKPFDQLIREHIAGDLLPSMTDEQHDDQLTGVGYLMLGAINYEEQDKEQLRMDVVDEQIDSTGRTFLGMTLGCARCHDHKFDPVPTSDYYALAGIFRSTKSLTPGNVCGFVTAPLRSGYDTEAMAVWTAEDTSLEQQIAALKKTAGSQKSGKGGPEPDSQGSVLVDDSDAVLEGEWISSMYQPPFLGDGYRHSGQPRKGISATYETALPADGEYLVRMVINHGDSRAENVPVLIVHADGESVVSVSQKQQPPGDGIFAELGRYRFESGQPAKVVVKAADASPGFVIVDAVQFVPTMLLRSPSLAPAELQYLSRLSLLQEKAELKLLEVERKLVEEKRKSHAKQKPKFSTVMCVEDESQPADWHIHVRGEIRNLGAVVPRGFLQAATAQRETTSPAQLTSAATSGRRELADWIASPANPLTARVYVNRVWANVMGEGIVRTPDNFGETGDRPTHPELLDFLASTFVSDDAWSTRQLIRRLCLSRTFRMASTISPASRESDPSNRYLTYAFRRRLDAEGVRDSLLQISGALELTLKGGLTIGRLGTYDNEYSHSEFPLNCRSIYVPSFRNTMLDLFEVFDAANPNLVTGRRNRSTRPAQALYMLNSPFVMQQARLAAESFLRSADFDVKNPETGIRHVWRLCTSRTPTSDEVAALLPIVAEQPDSVASWTTVFHALFASVEFRYLE